jgi:hypothetical protein
MKMLVQVRGLPVSSLMSVTPAADSTQAAETVAKAADEGSAGAVGEPVDPSPVAHDLAPGHPLRIFPESREAV